MLLARSGRPKEKQPAGPSSQSGILSKWKSERFAGLFRPTNLSVSPPFNHSATFSLHQSPVTSYRSPLLALSAFAAFPALSQPHCDQVFELEHATTDPSLHRAKGLTQLLGNFVLGQTGEKGELNRLTLFLRELKYR